MKAVNDVSDFIVSYYFSKFIDELDGEIELEFQMLIEAEKFCNEIFELAKKIEYELPSHFGFKIFYDTVGMVYRICSTNSDLEDFEFVKMIFKK